MVGFSTYIAIDFNGLLLSFPPYSYNTPHTYIDKTMYTKLQCMCVHNEKHRVHTYLYTIVFDAF